MKSTSLFIAAVICTGLIGVGVTQAVSVPKQINYQGVLKDDQGAKINDTVDIDIEIFFAGGGTTNYTESHSGDAADGSARSSHPRPRRRRSRRQRQRDGYRGPRLNRVVAVGWQKAMFFPRGSCNWPATFLYPP